MNDKKIVNFLPYMNKKSHIKKLSLERKLEYIKKETLALQRDLHLVIKDDVASYKVSSKTPQDLQRIIQNNLISYNVELTTTFPQRLSEETALPFDEVMIEIAKHIVK